MVTKAEDLYPGCNERPESLKEFVWAETKNSLYSLIAMSMEKNEPHAEAVKMTVINFINEFESRGFDK